MVMPQRVIDDSCSHLCQLESIGKCLSCQINFDVTPFVEIIECIRTFAAIEISLIKIEKKKTNERISMAKEC